MEDKIVYEAVFFKNAYHSEYQDLRDAYRSKFKKAMSNRKIDHNPMPNATTVVHLERNDDGDLRIVTTGDFVDFFNQKYGNRDRVGEVRRSLENARIIEENKKEERRVVQNTAIKNSAAKGFFGAVRTAKRRLFLAHAVFAVMLMTAMTMLLGSNLALDRASKALYVAQQEYSSLQNEGAEITQDCEVLGYNAESAASLAMDGGNQVEVYEQEENVVMSALLNAIMGGR